MKKQILSIRIACATLLLASTTGSFAGGTLDNLIQVFRYADDAAAALAKQGDNALDGANAGRRLDDVPGYNNPPPERYTRPPARILGENAVDDTPLLRPNAVKQADPGAPPKVVSNYVDMPPKNTYGTVVDDVTPGYVRVDDSAFKTNVLGDAGAGGKPALVSRNTGIDPNDLPTPPGARPPVIYGKLLPDAPKGGIFYNKIEPPLTLGRTDTGTLDNVAIGNRYAQRPGAPVKLDMPNPKLKIEDVKRFTKAQKVLIGTTVTGLVVAAGGGGVYVLYNTYEPVTEFVDNAVSETEKFGEDAEKKLTEFGEDAEKELTKFGKEAETALNEFGEKAKGGLSEFGEQVSDAADHTADAFKQTAVLTVNNYTDEKVELFEVVFGNRISRGVSEKPGDFVSYSGSVGDKFEIFRNGAYFTGFTLQQDELVYVQ